MPKPEKVQLLDNISSELQNISGLVLANFKGMSVLELDNLRKKVEAEGGTAKILKNTILEKAFERNKVSGMEPYLKENTIMFYSKDDVLKILKPIADYSKDNEKFVIKGGMYEGQALDKASVVAMSKMPGKKELLSMIVGNVEGIISSFVGTLNSVMTTFVGTIEAIEKKQK